MPAENAEYIHQLIKDRPTGGESISEGDDHLRAIKTAILGTFPEVQGKVDATHEDLNKIPELITDVEALDGNSHGNVVSCYWNPTFPEPLAYTHNVKNVVPNPADPSGMQTRVNFKDGVMDDDPHYSFSLTPVNGTARPTIITVVGVASDHLAFLSWHLVEGEWVEIPATELSFSLKITDMDAGQ